MAQEIRRKMDTFLREWKKTEGHLPLIVRGARQVGKTYSIRKFGETYRSFIEINFVFNPEFKDIFDRGYATDEVIKKISFIRRRTRSWRWTSSCGQRKALSPSR
ncbi:MAG: hypothetical protein II837_15660 [Treponema sp.]|nr:hypothetical protein [Treponema sp.]MBQ7166689.1 hypothetical protein [Treponema sp.]